MPIKQYSPSMEISFAIILQNEQDYISYCLENIKKIADEIVIVDGGSTDASLTIAQKYTDKIYHRKFDNDFSTQRNFAVERCKKPWIFMIDADETLEYNLLGALKDIINSNKNTELFYFPRINTIKDLNEKPWLISRYGWNVNSEGRINYPDIQGRLFKNDYPRIRWVDKVHERVEGAKNSIIVNNMHIIHEKNWTRQERQNNLYSSIQN
jgi:glycosyltransferase involved in cell wall biosynthesis